MAYAVEELITLVGGQHLARVERSVAAKRSRIPSSVNPSGFIRRITMTPEATPGAGGVVTRFDYAGAPDKVVIDLTAELTPGN